MDDEQRWQLLLAVGHCAAALCTPVPWGPAASLAEARRRAMGRRYAHYRAAMDHVAGAGVAASGAHLFVARLMANSMPGERHRWLFTGGRFAPEKLLRWFRMGPPRRRGDNKEAEEAEEEEEDARWLAEAPSGLWRLIATMHAECDDFCDHCRRLASCESSTGTSDAIKAAETGSSHVLPDATVSETCFSKTVKNIIGFLWGESAYASENYEVATERFAVGSKVGFAPSLSFQGYTALWAPRASGNYTLALSLFEQGAAQNHPLAIRNLARCYSEIQHNDERALVYWHNCACMLHPEGQFKYASMISGKDLREARKWCLLSANQGEAAIQMYLSSILLFRHY
ncbi:hypothetical protein Pelo_145 [Pelomyxa schiedti]|nr:hypothetical protein Pelo_145 [Pelomyxa schiedti]